MVRHADDVKMFEQWHQSDPQTDKERQIYSTKTKIQGNINPDLN
jgi:endonuclease I